MNIAPKYLYNEQLDDVAFNVDAIRLALRNKVTYLGVVSGAVNNASPTQAELTAYATAAAAALFDGKAPFSSLKTGYVVRDGAGRDWRYHSSDIDKWKVVGRDSWAIGDVAGLQDALNGKADSAALTAHASNGAIHITSQERADWNAKQNALNRTITLTGGVTGYINDTGGSLSIATTLRALTASDIPDISGTYLPKAGGQMSGVIHANFAGAKMQYGDGTYVTVGEKGTTDTDTLALHGSSGIELQDATSILGALKLNLGAGVLKTDSAGNVSVISTGSSTTTFLRNDGTWGSLSLSGNIALTGDVTGSAAQNASGVSVNTTIANNAVTYAKMQTVQNLSVLGNATNTNPAAVTAIQAGTDGYVLRRSGTTLGFGQIAAAGIADGVITTAKLASGIGVLGQRTATSAAPAYYAPTAAGQYLRSTAANAYEWATVTIPTIPATAGLIYTASANATAFSALSLAAGNIPYATAANTPSVIAAPSTTAINYLRHTAAALTTVPAWVAASGATSVRADIGLGSGTGALEVANGGTNLTSIGTGTMLYATAANTLGAVARNTSTTPVVLRKANATDATAPVWGKVDLSTDVTGTLPVANGGTGGGSGSGSYVLKAGDTMMGRLDMSITKAYTSIVTASALGIQTNSPARTNNGLYIQPEGCGGTIIGNDSGSGSANEGVLFLLAQNASSASQIAMRSGSMSISSTSISVYGTTVNIASTNNVAATVNIGRSDSSYGSAVTVAGSTVTINSTGSTTIGSVTSTTARAPTLYMTPTGSAILRSYSPLILQGAVGTITRGQGVTISSDNSSDMIVVRFLKGANGVDNENQQNNFRFLIQGQYFNVQKHNGSSWVACTWDNANGRFQ
ncbi:hypothetical protein R80B4_00975 [Fibrobacteres bacterium R8-0-B4]